MGRRRHGWEGERHGKSKSHMWGSFNSSCIEGGAILRIYFFFPFLWFVGGGGGVLFNSIQLARERPPYSGVVASHDSYDMSARRGGDSRSCSWVFLLDQSHMLLRVVRVHSLVPPNIYTYEVRLSTN